MRVNRNFLIATIAGVLATLSVSMRADGPATGTTESAPPFEEIDNDGDGAISASEAESSWLKDAFAQVDVNRDGSISKPEYERIRG